MLANVEQCENCGKLIGSLETPWVDNEQVVCAFCWATLRIVDQAQTVRQASIVRSTAHSPVASRLISAVTISAVPGLGGVAVFLARASARWFHGWYRLGTTTSFLARRRSPASGTNRDRESLSFKQPGQAFTTVQCELDHSRIPARLLAN